MTEAARKTLEEVKRSMMEKLEKEVNKKSIGEACDEAMMAIAVLSGVIKKVVDDTCDPVACVCGTALTRHLLETTKAIDAFKSIAEVAEIVREQEKNKNDQLS